MCDLSREETSVIVAALGEINILADQVRSHAVSIGQASYMDHEQLAAALAVLTERASAARDWVLAKPVENASHPGS